MSDFFLGQIMMTGFGYAPNQFAQSDGSLLLISQNSALYALLGNSYGGDGVRTFALPDLRGRTPAGAFASADPAWQPSPYPLGTIAGVQQVALTPDQNPPHTHLVTATSDPGTSGYLEGAQVLAQTSGDATLYGSAQTLVPLAGAPSGMAGLGSAHDNMQPFQVINFNIATSGIFPSRS